MRAGVRCIKAGRDRLDLYPSTHAKGTFMNTIIYIVGLVVIIGFILGYFGLR